MIELKQITKIDQLMEWRREVLRSVFNCEPSMELLAANSAYFSKHLPNGTNLAYVAYKDEAPVGCGNVCFYDEMPSPDNPTGSCAYLMNIYVRPEWRNQNVGTTIVSRLVNEALNRGCCKIYLESTEMARQMYEELGFADMQGFMKLKPSDTGAKKVRTVCEEQSGFSEKKFIV